MQYQATKARAMNSNFGSGKATTFANRTTAVLDCARQRQRQRQAKAQAAAVYSNNRTVVRSLRQQRGAVTAGAVASGPQGSAQDMGKDTQMSQVRTSYIKQKERKYFFRKHSFSFISNALSLSFLSFLSLRIKNTDKMERRLVWLGSR